MTSPAVSRRSLRLLLAVTLHEMRGSIRTPIFALMGLAQPLLYLVLFGPLLTGIAELSGQQGNHGGSWGLFAPAIFIQLAIFGGAFVGINLVTEFRSGALERLFATPLPRSAILGGRVLRDVCVLLAQTLVTAGVASALGFRTSPLALLACLGLVALVAGAMSSFSYLLALLTKSEDALSSGFNAILLPVILLAGIMLPMSLAPTWLQTLSLCNPLTYVVEAARAAVSGTPSTSTILLGYGVAVVVAVASFLLAARAFGRDDSL